jgi:hypothetical protein
VTVVLARYVTIALCSAAYGWSEKAIRRRMERGVWLENVHWRRAPDGGIVIDTKAVDKWLET